MEERELSGLEEQALRQWVQAGARSLDAIEFLASVGVNGAGTFSQITSIIVARQALIKAGYDPDLISDPEIIAAAVSASQEQHDIVAVPVLAQAAFVAETRKGLEDGLRIQFAKLGKLEVGSSRHKKCAAKIAELRQRLGR